MAVYPTVLNPGLPILLGAGATVFCALLKLVKGNGRYSSWGQEFATGLLGWMALSSFFALDQYLAQRSLATYVGALGFILVPQCCLSKGRHWRLCANSYVLVSTFCCISAWWVAWSESLASGEVPPLSGPFNNPDVFSALPLLGVLLALGLTERTSRWWRWVLFTQMGIGVISILASGCRSALLGLIVGSMAYSAILARKRPSALKNSKNLLVLPFVVLILSLPLSNFGLSASEKLSLEHLASESSDGTRYEVLWYGPLAVLKKPLLGAGPGCFGLSFQSVRPIGHSQLYIDTAHNDLMEMAVELGLPGFLLWAGLLCTAALKPYRLVASGRRPRAAAAACSSLAGAVVFQSFNFIVSERPAFWAFCWVLGLTLSFPTSRESWREPPAVRVISSGALLLLGLWAAQFGYRSILAERHNIRAEALARALRTKEAVTATEQALEQQPAAVHLLRKSAKRRKALAGFLGSQDQFEKAEAALSRAHLFSPRNVTVLLELAEFQASSERYQAARNSLAKAREAAPHHHLVLRRLTGLAVRQRNYPEAIELITLDATGYAERRGVLLPPLLHALELENPGEGTKLLANLLKSSPKSTWPVTALDTVIKKAAEAQHWSIARRFAELKLQAPGKRLCTKVLIAGFIGREKGAREGWMLLDSTFREAESQSGHCQDELLKAWATAGNELGKKTEIQQRLRTLLERDRRNLQARVLLVASLKDEGKSEEAIKLARAGLLLHERSLELTRALAELYEAIGSHALATNYYREASRLAPEDQSLKAKALELSRQQL